MGHAHVLFKLFSTVRQRRVIHLLENDFQFNAYLEATMMSPSFFLFLSRLRGKHLLDFIQPKAPYRKIPKKCVGIIYVSIYWLRTTPKIGRFAENVQKLFHSVH